MTEYFMTKYKYLDEVLNIGFAVEFLNDVSFMFYFSFALVDTNNSTCVYTL